MEFIQSELTKFFNNITLQDFKDRHADFVPLLEIDS
jgi:hypothetical protein